MRVYCAWCGSYIRNAKGCKGVKGNSHGGMCTKCYAQAEVGQLLNLVQVIATDYKGKADG